MKSMLMLFILMATLVAVVIISSIAGGVQNERFVNAKYVKYPADKATQMYLGSYTY